MTMELLTKTAAQIAAQAHGWLADARSLTIDDPAQYERSAGLLQLVKRARNDLSRERLAQTRPIDEQKARIMDAYRPSLDLLDNAESVLKRGMSTYDQQQREKARIEAARLAEIAERERQRLLARADAAEASGNVRQAAVLEDRAMAVAPRPITTETAPKVAGISKRENWRWEITNEAAIPREYLMVDTAKVGAVVRALKGATNIPGVRAYPEHTIAAKEA